MNENRDESESEDRYWTYSFQPDILESMKTYSVRVQWECKGSLPSTTAETQAVPPRSNKSDWGEEGMFVAPKICVRGRSVQECGVGQVVRHNGRAEGGEDARKRGRRVVHRCGGHATAS